MKKFIFELILFISLLTCTSILISLVLNNKIEQNDFYAAILDKHQCMQQSVPPRIVFIGDSNLIFGLDSETIENEFGYPVCNLAISAYLGLNFILAEANDLLKTGDIVILITSWNLNEGIPLDKAKIQQIYPYSAFYAYKDGFINSIKTISKLPYFFTRYNYLVLRDFFIKTNGTTSFKIKPHVYERNAFNKQGDLIRHLKPEYSLAKKITFNDLKRPTYVIDNTNYISQIESFQQKLKTHNIQLFYAFPPFPKTLYNTAPDAYQQYEINIRNESTLTILGSHKSFIFDDSLFYDSQSHLANVGRELRTNILIKFLRSALKLNR